MARLDEPIIAETPSARAFLIFDRKPSPSLHMARPAPTTYTSASRADARTRDALAYLPRTGSPPQRTVRTPTQLQNRLAAAARDAA
jgi:hypothetical protein